MNIIKLYYNNENDYGIVRMTSIYDRKKFNTVGELYNYIKSCRN